MNILKPHADLILGFSILNSYQQVIAHSRLCDHADYCDISEIRGVNQISFQLDLSLFHPGEYQIRLECSSSNKKKILQEDILLKFAIYSQGRSLKYEREREKDGISLGNRWSLNPCLTTHPS